MYDMEKHHLESSLVYSSTRPLPELALESPFSQRKRTPFRAPGPPNTCPPVSRIRQFRTPETQCGPQAVSFKHERKQDTAVLNSPHYNNQSKNSYLEQCFQVCEKLGEGSFGIVYSVSSRDDGCMYAVKKSRQPFKGGRDRKQKLAEVEKHERLPHHPNCIKFYKAWEERQKLYIQTELCQMSLSEYADIHGKVPEGTIWRMLMDLAKGLKHVHDHQLCHLDIKPANMFLAEDNLTYKVGDFGLCSSLEQGFVDAMEGDAKYLAPELMRHQFGKPADIFSLGISLLELACDVELPSGGGKWHLLRSGQIPCDLTEGLSPELVNTLSRMMHPDPKLRPTLDEILADPCVRLAGSKHSCYEACKWLLSTCKHILGRFLGVITLLLSIFPVKKEGMVGDSSSAVANPNGNGGRGGGAPAFHNESFSDDDDHYNLSSHTMADDVVDPKAKFNRSWIRNSPVKYPSPLYSGPPIPLDFGDSSFDSDGSPDKMSSLSKTVLHSFSSCNLPPVNGSPSRLGLPQNKLLLKVQPKNLFSD